MAHDIVPRLPGIDPAIPYTTKERARLLLALTRRLIDLRGEVRETERQIQRVTASLGEPQ